MKKKAKIIAWAIQKGGSSKTCSVVSTGAVLASKGYKVLLVDLDAQANLTSSLLSDEYEENIYTAMMGKSQAQIISVKENLDVIPASMHLAIADKELADMQGAEYLLKNLLEPIKHQYDFILLDCAPSLGIITMNAISASDYVIIPLVAEILPFEGLKIMLQYINMVKVNLNPKVKLAGILITIWQRSNLSTTIENRLREEMKDKVFATRIRKNISLAETPYEKKDIITYKPKSNGAKDYTTFTEELLTRLNITKS